jgi:hypothetical protein
MTPPFQLQLDVLAVVVMAGTVLLLALGARIMSRIEDVKASTDRLFTKIANVAKEVSETATEIANIRQALIEALRGAGLTSPEVDVLLARHADAEDALDAAATALDAMQTKAEEPTQDEGSH